MRRRLIIAALLILTAAGAWSLFWHFGKNRLIAAAAALGAADKVAVEGYPWQWRVRVAGATTMLPGGWRLALASAVVEVPLFDPGRMVIHLAKSLSLADGAGPSLDMAFGYAGLRLDLKGRSWRHLGLTLSEAVIAGDPPPLGNRLERLTLDLRPEADGYVLERLDLAWGPLRIETKGRLIAEPGAQLKGAVLGTFEGYEEALSRFVAAGRIDAAAASAAAADFGAKTRDMIGADKRSGELALEWNGAMLVLGGLALIDRR
ncbi:MAG: DUF2125 domain-containing protein [Alphaproteobacteria bacterium]|nr:DUF2125 domain-containing protein [Alphaproteobacteria bacterium]